MSILGNVLTSVLAWGVKKGATGIYDAVTGDSEEEKEKSKLEKYKEQTGREMQLEMYRTATNAPGPFDPQSKGQNVAAASAALQGAGDTASAAPAPERPTHFETVRTARKKAFEEEPLGAPAPPRSKTGWWRMGGGN